jgi:nucleotide-binding universal stress UspA family protein
MLKHVLVPLDGSQLAEEALFYARNIVDPNGRITLVAAVDVPEAAVYGYYPAVNLTDYEHAFDDMLPTAKRYLETIVSKLNDGHLTVVAEAHMGDAAEIIVTTAERCQVDAIVMSTHGRSGLSRWLLGSVSNKVLSAKPCPVFIVPSGEKRKTAEVEKAAVN